MSSVIHPQSEQPSEHEELVAYLDGELGPEDSRRVEERLANDAEYRQHLRDLDQAWEALGALPTTAVDDNFARTTIELACVAAEEDLSQRTSLAAVENRGRRRWWIAGAVAAAVIGFIMVRALAVHRNNMLLTDLPVIAQVNALSRVRDVDFLQKLSETGFGKEVAKDGPAFQRELTDFAKANSQSLDERRDWVNSLTPEQKADLAEKTRAYEELRLKPEEKDRLQKLASDVRSSPELEATLVAFGQWLSRQVAPWEQEQLRTDFPKLSTAQQVAAIQKLAEKKKQQEVYHLSPSDRVVLRSEILALADKKKEELAAAGIDKTNKKAALWVVMREGDAIGDQLISTLSPVAQEHFNRIPKWPRDGRRRQLLAWIHEAVEPKPTAEDLGKFFASDAVSLELRQKLLDMPKSEMDEMLERLYLRSQLGIDERFPLFRELGEVNRSQRNPPRDGERPDGRAEGRRRGVPQRGPEGLPGDGRFRPEGPPPEFDPEGPPPRPGERPGLRPEDEGPRRGRPPRDRDQPNGPPGQPFGPPPEKEGPPK